MEFSIEVDKAEIESFSSWISSLYRNFRIQYGWVKERECSQERFRNVDPRLIAFLPVSATFSDIGFGQFLREYLAWSGQRSCLYELVLLP